MGSLLSGSNKQTNTSTPWAPQGAALQDVFNKAGTAFGNKEGTPFYEGELFAGMDPETSAAIQRMLAYSQNGGAAAADKLGAAGNSLTDPAAVTGAINKFAAAAGADPTQSNIANATAYANNPAIDGMIDAAGRDVRRNLYENELPGLNRAATAGGNVNSSRAGVAEGIMHRGAADSMADISAGLRGQAFDRGLAMSENARASNMGAMGTAAGLYGQQFGQGADALSRSRDMNVSNIGTAIDASSLYQTNNQGQLDADFAKWQGQDSRDMDLLAKYYGIVGSNNWGGTQTQTTKSSPSILGAVTGLGSLAAGFGLFGGGAK